MRGGLDLLKHCFRPSRARRALRGGNLFAAAGFGVPLPLCLVEERAALMTVSSALITAEVTGWCRLADALAGRGPAGRMDAAARRDLVAALAREVAAIHNAGLVHGDMRGGNVGVVAAPGGPRFCWMDNEGCRRPALRRRRLQARNLVQLNMLREGVTQADRLAFWRIYCRARGLRGRERRATLARVVRETRRRWAKRGWA